MSDNDSASSSAITIYLDIVDYDLLKEYARLPIDNGRRTVADGYTCAVATDAKMYFYRYWGGLHNLGDLTVRGPESWRVELTNTVQAQLHDTQLRYEILSLHSSSGQFSQAAIDTGTPGGKWIEIHDGDTGEGGLVKYSLLLKDRETQAQFWCDPRVSNDPPPGGEQ